MAVVKNGKRTRFLPQLLAPDAEKIAPCVIRFRLCLFWVVYRIQCFTCTTVLLGLSLFTRISIYIHKFPAKFEELTRWSCPHWWKKRGRYNIPWDKRTQTKRIDIMHALTFKFVLFVVLLIVSLNILFICCLCCTSLDLNQELLQILGLCFITSNAHKSRTTLPREGQTYYDAHMRSQLWSIRLQLVNMSQ